MADELNESAEFGRKHKNEEEPILVAQRFLNIYRQMHIFNEERRNQFDDMLLQVPPDIRILFSTLPGGSLLIEHIEELEKKHGLIPTSIPSKTTKPELHKRTDKEDVKTGKPATTAGTVVIDASFANELSSSLSLALQQTERRYKEDIKTLTETITKSIMESQSAIGNMIKDILLSAQNNMGSTHAPITAPTPLTALKPEIPSAQLAQTPIEHADEPIITKKRLIENNRASEKNSITIQERIEKAPKILSDKQAESANESVSEEKIEKESEPRLKSEPKIESTHQVATISVAALAQDENSSPQPEKKKKKKKKNKNHTAQNEIATTASSDVSKNMDTNPLQTDDFDTDILDISTPEESDSDINFSDIDENILNDTTQENFENEIVNAESNINVDNYLSNSNNESLFKQDDTKNDDDFSFLDNLDDSSKTQESDNSINQNSPYKNELSQIKQALEINTTSEDKDLTNGSLIIDDMESDMLPPDFDVKKIAAKQQKTAEKPKEDFTSKSVDVKSEAIITKDESSTNKTNAISDKDEIVSLDSIDDAPISLDDINFDNQFSFNDEPDIHNHTDTTEANNQQTLATATDSTEAKSQDATTNSENNDWEWEYVEDNGSDENDWEWEYVEDDDDNTKK